ncbi:MAG: ribonuclease Z [Anaerolineae bacterium]
MFEIVFLGTSASAPSIHRGLTSQVILAGEYRFMIDCGEGTQRQILRSGIGFKKLNHILLTHAHLDHILGLGGLISTFGRWEGDMDEVAIWGGKPALDRVESLMFDVVFRNEKPPILIHLVTLKPGTFIETKQFSVTAFPVTHRGQGNFGFVFEEYNRRPFLVEKAEALGVPAGPERARLVRGEAISLASGEVITPDMVLGEEIAGTKLVYVGDTGRTDNLREYAEQADTLVIESTFIDADAEIAQQFGHITARQAALLALESGAKTLILNHISRRYSEREVIQEARSVFPDTFVARDLDHYVIKRGEKAEKKVEATGHEQ